MQSTVVQCIFCKHWQMDYALEDVMSYLPRYYDFNEGRRWAFDAIEYPLQEHVAKEHPREYARLTDEKRLV